MPKPTIGNPRLLIQLFSWLVTRAVTISLYHRAYPRFRNRLVHPRKLGQNGRVTATVLEREIDFCSWEMIIDEFGIHGATIPITLQVPPYGIGSALFSWSSGQLRRIFSTVTSLSRLCERLWTNERLRSFENFVWSSSTIDECSY